jgi:hypothetical protein
MDLEFFCFKANFDLVFILEISRFKQSLKNVQMNDQMDNTQRPKGVEKKFSAIL